MAKKTHKQEDIEAAYKLYKTYIPATEISERIGIPRTTVSYWIRAYNWKEKRELEAADLVHAVTDAKKFQLLRLSGLTTDLLLSSLKALTERDEPLTIKEAERAANIYGILDKILKLDEGRPTDIVGEDKPATIIEIKKRLDADPFNNKKEIVFDSGEEEATININHVKNRDESDSEEEK